MAPDPIQDLITIFLRFPGIGRRQAQRFVYHLLSQPKREISRLSENLRRLQDRVGECRLCHRFHLTDQAEKSLCSICRDSGRDRSQLLIIEKDADLDNLEKAGIYRGHYFVLLAGNFNPEEPAVGLRLAALATRLKATPEITEVIIALSANTDGDQQTALITTTLAPFIKNGLMISTLGRGLSSGAELEYADPETLKNALASRHH